MSIFKSYLQKMSGGASLPALPKFSFALLAGLGAGLAIYLGKVLQGEFEIALMMAPFGASAFLAFSLPDSPLAQPRNIVAGHVISTFCGLVVLHLIGDGAAFASLAVAFAVFAMLLTRTSHAPAGADPLVVFALQPGWDFLVTPVLFGSVMLSLLALLINNFRYGVRYPKYW